jgi:hypothetical protein
MYTQKAGLSPKVSHTGRHCVGWHAVVCYGAPEWSRIQRVLAGTCNAFSINFPWLAENGMHINKSHECCLASSFFEEKVVNIHVEPYQPILKASFEFIPFSVPKNPSCNTQSAHCLPYSCFPGPPARPHLSSSSPTNPNTSSSRAGSSTLPSALPRSSPIWLVESALQLPSPPTLNHHHGLPVSLTTTLPPSSGAGTQLVIAVCEPVAGTPQIWPPATPSSGTPRKHGGTAQRTSCSDPVHGSSNSLERRTCHFCRHQASRLLCSLCKAFRPSSLYSGA